MRFAKRKRRVLVPYGPLQPRSDNPSFEATPAEYLEANTDSSLARLLWNHARLTEYDDTATVGIVPL